MADKSKEKKQSNKKTKIDFKKLKDILEKLNDLSPKDVISMNINRTLNKMFF